MIDMSGHEHILYGLLSRAVVIIEGLEDQTEDKKAFKLWKTEIDLLNKSYEALKAIYDEQ